MYIYIVLNILVITSNVVHGRYKEVKSEIWGENVTSHYSLLLLNPFITTVDHSRGYNQIYRTIFLYI